MRKVFFTLYFGVAVVTIAEVTYSAGGVVAVGVLLATTCVIGLFFVANPKIG